MTRAFISILQFNFNDALNYNMMSIPLFLGIVFYNMLLLMDIFFGKEFVTKLEKILAKKYMYTVYFILFLTIVILKYT